MNAIDVLAVMDREIESAAALAVSDAYHAERLPKLREARTAVAELRAQAANMAALKHKIAYALSDCPETLEQFYVAMKGLDTAIARCHRGAA